MDVLHDQHRRIAELFDRVSSPDEERPKVLHALIRELTGHVAAERAAMAPALRQHGLDGVSEWLDEDHARMEKLMVLIERRKFNSPDLPDLVSDLKETSDRHAGRSEEELFPRLGQNLTVEEQAELADRLASSDGVVASHPHPHLLSLGPVADLMTRVASWWDRARDRTAMNRQHTEDEHKVHLTRPARKWTEVRGKDDPVEGSDPSMGGAT